MASYTSQGSVWNPPQDRLPKIPGSTTKPGSMTSRMGGSGGTDPDAPWGYEDYWDSTNNTWKRRAKPDPAIKAEQERREQELSYERMDRQTAMSAAQGAAPIGQSTRAGWTVGPDGAVSFQGPTGGGSWSEGGGGGGTARDPSVDRADRDKILAMLTQALQGGSAPVIQHGGGGQASSAAFSRAKEQAAQTNRAALNALYDMGAESGRAGSPLEAGLASQVAQQGQGNLADFSREQAIYDAQRGGEIADQSYQGGIAQRGQDLSRQMQIIQSLLSAYGQMY